MFNHIRKLFSIHKKVRKYWLESWKRTKSYETVPFLIRVLYRKNNYQNREYAPKLQIYRLYCFCIFAKQNHRGRDEINGYPCWIIVIYKCYESTLNKSGLATIFFWYWGWEDTYWYWCCRHVRDIENLTILVMYCICSQWQHP